MELSENYRILYDNYNVILQFHEEREIKSNKTGKERIGEVVEDTFHPTVKGAMMAFLQKSIRGSDSVQECMDRINEVENKIIELSEQLKIKQL